VDGVGILFLKKMHLVGKNPRLRKTDHLNSFKHLTLFQKLRDWAF
jgi:hypothetical protein